MLVVVRVEAVTLVGAVGACVSAHADVVTVMFAGDDALPAASTALTPMEYAVRRVRPVERVAGCSGGADFAAGAVDVVAGDGDVVGGSVPGDRDARCGGRCDPQIRWLRRSRSVGGWCRLVVDGGGDGVGGEQGAAVVEGAYLEAVGAVGGGDGAVGEGVAERVR